MSRKIRKLMVALISVSMLFSGTLMAFAGTESVQEDGSMADVTNEESVDISENGERDPEILKDSSGSCGEFLNYSYTEGSKTMSFSGKGDMWDYNTSGHSSEIMYRSGGGYYSFYKSARYHFDNYKEQYDNNNNHEYFYYSSPWFASSAATLDVSGASNMTHIGARAFYTMESLTAPISIPEKVKSIGEQAFEDTAIPSLSLNENLREIGKRAFKNCKNLSGTLVLSERIESIGEEAFSGDTSLDISFDKDQKLESIAKDAFRGCGISGKITFPSGLKSIGNTAFYANSEITEVYIPSGIEGIAEDAFENCSNIEKVTFGGTKERWDSAGFKNVKGLNDDYIQIEYKGQEMYTVVFDSNGGSEVGSQTVAVNSLLNKPADPKKDGFTFQGWFTDGSKKWDFSKDKVTKNITLTAKWSESGGSGGSGGGNEEPDPDDTVYTINASAGEGGSIYPSGDVSVGEGKDKTFTITPDDGYIISNVLIDGLSVGGKGSYTFSSVDDDHTIEAVFMQEETGFRVHFETYDADEPIEDQYVKAGDLVVRPLDPVKDGYEFKGWFKESTFDNLWDFSKDTVAANITIYAYYVATSNSTSDIYLKSSTGMHGKWINTVIGQGCTVKLFLANSEGAKMKGIKKKDVTWDIKPYNNDGTKATDYFVLKKGKLKCKKNAPIEYKAIVSATYNGRRVFYVVEVIKKIAKMGYYSNGKFKKSFKVTRTPGSYCDYGYGPHHYFAESGTYVCYFDKNNGKIGTALYRQPDGSSWYTTGYYPEGKIYYCSAKVPKKTGILSRDVRGGSGYYTSLYYFVGQKGSYTVTYIAPDGSGKKFKLKFKAKKNKKKA